MRYWIAAQDPSRETSVELAQSDDKEVAVQIARLFNEHMDLREKSPLTVFATGGYQAMVVRVFDTEDDMNEVEGTE